MSESSRTVNGTNGLVNIDKTGLVEDRSQQLRNLLEQGVPELCNFVARADGVRMEQAIGEKHSNGTRALFQTESESIAGLERRLKESGFLNFDQGAIRDNLADILQIILKHSVNTSAPGFLDKLYAAPLPPGVFAELVLAVLNTNVHVYQVSPVLTLVEKHVTKLLAEMFGLTGQYRGGISVQGGSASNMTALTIARNTKFPETKTDGNAAVPGGLVVFTSAHGHYSIEKAAQAIGLGSKNVITVPVDDLGRMIPSHLDRLIERSKLRGEVPYFVNATAGTTVLGSFDPLQEIHQVTKKHNLWLHVDAAWGGGFVFSKEEFLVKQLRGIGFADSIATNPHKMLGIPVTCSFLLGDNLRQFQEANTLKAGYLFHQDEEAGLSSADAWNEPQDLADLTLQCGRRGDALKFFMALKYYGLDWYGKAVNSAYDLACYAHEIVRQHPDLSAIIPSSPPSCLQVCFSFTPAGHHVHGIPPALASEHDPEEKTSEQKAEVTGKSNSRITAAIAKRLISKGFMIDYAPALEGQTEKGAFFRIVINISTVRGTIDLLLRELVSIGHQVASEWQINGSNYT